jgi:hypothetical protein
LPGRTLRTRPEVTGPLGTASTRGPPGPSLVPAKNGGGMRKSARYFLSGRVFIQVASSQRSLATWSWCFLVRAHNAHIGCGRFLVASGCPARTYGENGAERTFLRYARMAGRAPGVRDGVSFGNREPMAGLPPLNCGPGVYAQASPTVQTLLTCCCLGQRRHRRQVRLRQRVAAGRTAERSQ